MKLTYKCKGCKRKLELEPQWDMMPVIARDIVLKTLLELKNSEYCSECRPEVKDNE